jgi:hypothetical protein
VRTIFANQNYTYVSSKFEPPNTSVQSVECTQRDPDLIIGGSTACLVEISSSFRRCIGRAIDGCLVGARSADITVRMPIACSFWRCPVLALFQHIWWAIRTQHSERVDFAHPGQDENTITTKPLVRFTSNHQNWPFRGRDMLIYQKSPLKAHLVTYGLKK